MSDDTPAVKTCTECGVTQPLFEFYPHRSGKYGRASKCRACGKLRCAAWYAAHREQVKARASAYYATHRDAGRAQRKRYAEGTRDRRRAYLAVYQAVNRQRLLAARNAWCLRNPERARQIRNDVDARRRARMLHAPMGPPFSRADVWARDGGRCHVCGRKADAGNWHLDHLVPLSRGGAHSLVNVAVAHPWCNIRRNAYGPAQLRLALDA